MRLHGFDDSTVKVPFDRAWPATVGFEVFEADGDAIGGRLPITEAVCQPLGLVHGGIYACIAEELASLGTAKVVTADGKLCLGQSNVTYFFRPGTLGGTLHGLARPIHRGRTSWVWDVEIHNEDGKLCARSTVTMAVRSPP
jgi:uncharacterized protein (TIGR00369 family)